MALASMVAPDCDDGVQRRGRGALAVEVAADLDMPPPASPRGVDHGAGKNADIIAE